MKDMQLNTNKEHNIACYLKIELTFHSGCILWTWSSLNNMMKQLLLTYISASISENIVYYWLVIHPFFKVIHRQNCDEISFDWYNCIVLMKTGY